jgi:hypothetical protein
MPFFLEGSTVMRTIVQVIIEMAVFTGERSSRLVGATCRAGEVEKAGWEGKESKHDAGRL